MPIAASYSFQPQPLTKAHIFLTPVEKVKKKTVAMDFVGKKYKMVSSENFDEFMKAVGRKYKLISSDNFDDFMKILGVGLITRKAANAVTPTVELRKEGDTYNLVTSSTFKTTEIKFKPGEEFDEDRADGAKVKSVCTFEGNNTLKQVQKATDGLEVVYVREFSPDEMKATMTAKDVTCVRVYKAQ